MERTSEISRTVGETEEVDQTYHHTVTMEVDAQDQGVTMESPSETSRSTVGEIEEVDEAYHPITIGAEAQHQGEIDIMQHQLNRKLGEMMQRRWDAFDDGHYAASIQSIRRIPPGLSGIDFRAERPEIVSIGPFHLDRDEDGDNVQSTLEFNKHKWYFLNSLLLRSKRKLGVFYKEIKEVESKARMCYSEEIPMSSYDFVEMMVVDGCFIVELLIQVNTHTRMDYQRNPIVQMPHLIPILMRDLLKLENQLPFFVLEKFYSCTVDTKDPNVDSLILLALKFFNQALPRPTENIKYFSKSTTGFTHLLYLFHKSYAPYRPYRLGNVSIETIEGIEVEREYFGATDELRESSPTSNLSNLSIQCVTQLRSSGIKFMPRKADNFLKLNFRHGCKTNLRDYVRGWIDSWEPDNWNLMTLLGWIETVAKWIQTVVKWIMPFILLPFEAVLKFINYFRDGVLEIPPITINEFTSTALINCVALELEQSRSSGRYYHFMEYVACMSCLVNSRRDAALLSADGIINNYSESEEYVARLFNDLGRNINLAGTHYRLSHQYEQMNTYYNSYPAIMKRVYFHSPWSYVSVFSAALLLFFTITQTYYAALSYVHRSH